MSPNFLARSTGSVLSRMTRMRAALTAATLLITIIGSGPVLASRAPAGAPPGSAQAALAASANIPRVPGGTNPVVWEATRGVTIPERPDGPALIHLGAGYELDPTAPGAEDAIPADLRATAPTGDQRGYWIVQFHGPISSRERLAIETAGGRIVSYVPDYAFVVSMTGDARARLSRSPEVAWTGLYQPAYKISTVPQMQEPGVKDMILLLFPDESLDAVSREATAAGAVVKEVYDNGINRMIRAAIDPANISPVARIQGIAWIEPHKIPQWHNDQCQWVVQTWTANNRRVWDMGVRGEGQVVSLCDTGIRTTHNQFKDASVPITTFGDFPTHRKIIAYKKAIEITQITFGDDGGNGYHGTHTSCTAAGDDQPNGASTKDGMAIHGKIYFLDGGSAFAAGVYVPPDLNDLMILPYNGNAGGAARIMTNSWGNSIGGAYDLHSMTADQFMWSHPDFLPFFSNGNDGGANTVGSPATAKNVVSAGGTGNGVNANQIYPSTSRGPTDDGRFKPTICAPATLSSANGQGDTGYIQYSGTSMASPAMAGATVLLRQYLADGWYPTGAVVPGNAVPDPSAALMKAMAINSADPDVGSYVVPDNNIGWGRIDDDQVLYFSGDTRRLALVDNTNGLLTGEYVEYQVVVASRRPGSCGHRNEALSFQLPESSVTASPITAAATCGVPKPPPFAL